MIENLAPAVVVLAALYLIGLAAATFLAPSRAARFLDAFAGSARAHYTECSIRLLVGIALVLAAPRMRYPAVLQAFGWLIVVTTLVLLILPWRWHQRFARVVVPPLTRRVWWFGLLSLPLGGALLYAALS